MNGIHDMGGMHGFGLIERDDNEPRFHAAWEARVHAMANMAVRQGWYNLDADRYGGEQMPPAEYLRVSYFERWLATMEYNLAEQSLLSGEELAARIAFLRDHPGIQPPRARHATPPPPTPEAHPEPQPPPSAPRFAVGDAVVARTIHPVGHTRLPRYARGKRGVIQAVRGPWVFPDTNAHGRGEHRHVVYNVRFAGRDLWGDAPDLPTVVHLDLWESYLEPHSDSASRLRAHRPQ